MNRIDHIAGYTWHGRKGAVENAFRYGVDYLLLDAERPQPMPALFKRNKGGLTSVWDSDHGGPPKQGRGAPWVRAVLAANGMEPPAQIELLTQPRVLGHVFNPVSFWLCRDADVALRVVIAEVTNTFGDRHSYLVHRQDHGVVTAEDRLMATKLMHVSPFQPVEGGYAFRFDIRPDRIGIWIDYTVGNGGVIATLVGDRKPLSNAGILGAVLRRPLGSRRVLALIHWQALRLWWKGAAYRPRPEPPVEEVSR